MAKRFPEVMKTQTLKLRKCNKLKQNKIQKIHTRAHPRETTDHQRHNKISKAASKSRYITFEGLMIRLTSG